MTTAARLFRTIDILTVLTGVSLDRCGRRRVDELVRYVTGSPSLSLPAKRSSARREVVIAIRSQLPAGLDTFGGQDLVKLVMQTNTGQQEDQLITMLVEILERRYGQQQVLCPEHTLETPCKSLLLLRSLAESPHVKISME